MPSRSQPEAHPLPQSTLSTPLFAGVEAAVLGFEIGALAVVVHLSGRRWLTVLLTGLVLAGLHLALAAATRKDRRLSLVLSRSLRYPRRALSAPTQATRVAAPEPTFPRKVLT